MVHRRLPRWSADINTQRKGRGGLHDVVAIYSRLQGVGLCGVHKQGTLRILKIFYSFNVYDNL